MSLSVNYFALPDHLDPSNRVNQNILQHIDHFYALALDVHMDKRFNDPFAHGAVLRKPLSHFATADHITLYGRPLWYGCRFRERIEIQGFVLGKLLQVSNGIHDYNTNNIHHVFATMSAQIAIDPCLNNQEAVELVRKTVNSHLRVIINLDCPSDRMGTTTPVEPIVAQAVTLLLMEKDDNDKRYWARSIKTFSGSLSNPGLTEKGLWGELFTRLVLVISRDYYLSENRPMPNLEDTESESEDMVVTKSRTKRLRTRAFPSLSDRKSVV